eukprot:1865681-Rhodomonas_salina.2
MFRRSSIQYAGSHIKVHTASVRTYAPLLRVHIECYGPTPTPVLCRYCYAHSGTDRAYGATSSQRTSPVPRILTTGRTRATVLLLPNYQVLLYCWICSYQYHYYHNSTFTEPPTI